MYTIKATSGFVILGMQTLIFLAFMDSLDCPQSVGLNRIRSDSTQPKWDNKQGKSLGRENFYAPSISIHTSYLVLLGGPTIQHNRLGWLIHLAGSLVLLNCHGYHGCFIIRFVNILRVYCLARQIGIPRVKPPSLAYFFLILCWE